MVLKGQLCDWFSKLGPFKRIEYMCALLHLCLPLELRFLGTVLEDLCKKDFIYLREGESLANSVSMLSKSNLQLPNIIVSLTLLNSTNTKCANILYNVLQSYLQSCFNKILSKELDDHQKDAFTDLMTVLTLAVNHPAFSFEQKQSLSEFYLRALEYSQKLEQDELDLDLCSPHSCGSSHPPLHQHEVCITGIELKDARRNSDNLELNIQVKLSNGVILDIWKTSQEIYDFNNRLSGMFHNHNTIPILQTSNVKDERILFSNYIRKISQLPKDILDNDYVCEFFGCHQMNKMLTQANLSPKSTYCPSSSPSNLSADEEQIGIPIPPFQIKSLTFQNPQYPCPNIDRAYDQLPPPVSVIPNRLNGSGVLSAQNDTPSHSPLSSCTNSTQNSPSSSPLSQTPDMISITQLLKLLKMEEYSDQLSKYTVQELRSLIDEDLVITDLPKQAHVKLRKKLTEYFREKPNGIIEPHVMPPNVSAMVTTVPWQTYPVPPPGYYCTPNPPLPSTRDSSPSNSEYSSPSASPHLPTSNNIKSSNSSGSEDKNQRDEKESTPTGSLPRLGKGHGGKFIPPNRDMLPPHPGSYPDPSLDPTAIHNGFLDNPHHIASALRPDMLNNGRPFPHGKPLPFQHKPIVMTHDKAGNPIVAPYFIPQAHLPTIRSEYSIPTSMLQGENRQYLNQPGILGQPPVRPGNTATMTNAVGPHTSLTPTPPMTVNTGTKSPNNVSVPTMVNSSSESNLQNPEQSNSPSPLPMNNAPAAIPTVPCTSGGPVIHNHQPCSACGSRPQPFPFTAGYLPTSNGFMQMPSMPHPYQHMHPHPHILTPDMLNAMPPAMFPNYPIQPFLSYANYIYGGVNNIQANKKINCYNCGSTQHKASECKEATMESTAGNYHLNYKKSDSD